MGLWCLNGYFNYRLGFLQLLDSQIMEFRKFLGIETLEKCQLLEMWQLRIEN
jgi:hypothetical protein